MKKCENKSLHKEMKTAYLGSRLGSVALSHVANSSK
jgi:hypothetical protein